MRSSTLVARILCTLLVFVSLSAAWPWPPNGNMKGHGMVIARQNNGEFEILSLLVIIMAINSKNSLSLSDDENTDTATETAEPTKTAETATAAETGKTEDSTKTGTETSKETGTETGTNTEEETSTITDIDPRLPAGGIEMIEPGPLALTTYYKIGDEVTFKWNYTSLSVTPTGINVVASCAVNNQKYTLASNETVKETGAVTWDTGKYQADATVPLLTETYTLLVYDAEKDPDDIAPAGYLGAFNQFRFGMYTPQPYTPLGGKFYSNLDWLGIEINRP